MLSKISWQQFAFAVIVLLFIYYLFIGLTLYRKQLPGLIERLRKGSPRTKSGITGTELHIAARPADNDVELPTDIVRVERIINEVRYEILPKAGSHATKEKLLIVFKNYLSGFSNDNLPIPFKTGINQLIVKEVATQCNVLLDPEEIAALW